MDLFTTSLALAGLNVPGDRIIDGLDLRSTLFNNSVIERCEWTHTHSNDQNALIYHRFLTTVATGKERSRQTDRGSNRCRKREWETTVVYKVFCWARNGIRLRGSISWQCPSIGWLITTVQHSPILFHTQQARILLPWQWDDGSAGRAVQGALLDVDQLVGGVETGQNYWTALFLFFSHSVSWPKPKKSMQIWVTFK